MQGKAALDYHKSGRKEKEEEVENEEGLTVWSMPWESTSTLLLSSLSIPISHSRNSAVGNHRGSFTAIQ